MLLFVTILNTVVDINPFGFVKNDTMFFRVSFAANTIYNADWNAHFMYICKTSLKMLGLYIYTLMISHKSCKMLSILNKLTLQKDFQILWQIMCLRTKSKQNNNKTENQT